MVEGVNTPSKPHKGNGEGKTRDKGKDDKGFSKSMVLENEITNYSMSGQSPGKRKVP